MDIIRTIWIVNFIKKFDEFKEVAPAEPESQKKAPKPNPQGSR